MASARSHGSRSISLRYAGDLCAARSTLRRLRRAPGQRRLLVVPHRAVSRSETWRRAPRSVGWSRSMRRSLREQLQRHLDGFVELRIGTPRVVVWCIVDLDIRVGAVVFDSPADVVEEKRELRLRRHGAIDQSMSRPDADHTTPGAFPDKWPELQHFERVREDIAVGAG